MSLRAAYAGGFLLATTSAMLCVLLGGAMPLVAWLALLAPLGFLRLVLGPDVPRPALGRIGTLIGVVASIYGLSIVVARGLESLVVGATTALMGILAGRVMSRENLTHDLQALLLSLLLVFAGAVLHTQMTYGLVFVLYAVSTTWALTLRQLWAGAARDAERTAKDTLTPTLSRRDIVTPRFFVAIAVTALMTLATTSALFAIFPRVGFGGLAFLKGARHRLPDGVRLDEAPRGLDAGDEVVARVTGVPYGAFARGLYLRAAIFESLQPQGFVAAPPRRIRRAPLASAPGELEYEVFLAPSVDVRMPVLGPFSDATLVSGGLVAGIRTLSFTEVGATGTLTASQPPDGPLRYRVRGHLSRWADEITHIEATAGGEEVRNELADALVLPGSIDARVVELGQKVAGDAGDAAAKAARLREYLLANYHYSLDVPARRVREPLVDFLFDDKRGHCEFFAAAFATLLRSVGVPARVVGGFAGGAWDDDGGVVVFTAKEAHAWVEWYAPGVGWVTDDATPVSDAPRPRLTGLVALLEKAHRVWDTYVLDYDLDEQFALARRVIDSVGGPPALPKLPLRAVGALVLLALVSPFAARAGWLRYRRRRNAVGVLAEALARACANALGAAVLSHETLRQAVSRASRVTSRSGALALTSALGLYERARFGAAPITADELRAALTALAAVPVGYSS